MANSVNIRGIERVLNKFRDFGDTIKVELQEELVASCMIEIETPAKEKITRDGHVDTGRLRASIFTKSTSKRQHTYRDNEGNSYNCDLSSPVEDLKVSVGTNVEYAKKIERIDSYMLYAFKKGVPKVIKNLDKVIERTCQRYD